jgi:hypothetical protein
MPLHNVSVACVCWCFWRRAYSICKPVQLPKFFNSYVLAILPLISLCAICISWSSISNVYLNFPCSILSERVLMILIASSDASVISSPWTDCLELWLPAFQWCRMWRNFHIRLTSWIFIGLHLCLYSLALLLLISLSALRLQDSRWGHIYQLNCTLFPELSRL